jgi:molybdopterin-guanine dinucleotide biosynthesis protein A
MHFGGLILCGGKSMRMGHAKALLPFGKEAMLERVVRLLSEVVSPVVVVAAPEQPLPHLPPDTLVARDRREGRGPLEGLRAGLSALQGRCDAAYAGSCDAPRLAPAFARRMMELLGDHQIAVEVHTRRVPVEELRSLDPELNTLANLNHPEDYVRALAAEGLTPDPEFLARLAQP